MDQNIKNYTKYEQQVTDDTISILNSISTLTNSIAKRLEIINREKLIDKLPKDKS